MSKTLFRHKKNTKEGFTLIELLVVIAIIGLLSAVVLAGLQNARSRARDTKRVAEVRSVEKAIALYALDNGGLAPHSSFNTMANVPRVGGANGLIDCTARGVGSNYENTNQLYDRLISGKYLSAKPLDDPLESLGYCYVYVSSSDSLALAGVQYDAEGNLLGSSIILAALDGTKSRNAVFFAPSENTRTLSGNSAMIGVSSGMVPPVVLNIDLTTGLTHNTLNYAVGGSGI